MALGLEHGAADLLELVTPTTAELLHWWFGQDMVDARGGLNFHAGQKQAILNAIVAHEVLGTATLKDLYAQVAPDALLAGTLLAEVSAGKDSVTGHWELMGIQLDAAFPTFPNGFPASIIQAFEASTRIPSTASRWPRARARPG